MEHLADLSGSARWRALAFHAGKAMLIGLLLGTVITAVFQDLAHAWNYLFISCLCSLVIGLGFYALPPSFLDPTQGNSPRRISRHPGQLQPHTLINALNTILALIRNLDELEPLLAPDFIRPHRSALVALCAIQELEAAPGDPGELRLKDGSRLPVSRERLPEVRRRLGVG